MHISTAIFLSLIALFFIYLPDSPPTSAFAQQRNSPLSSLSDAEKTYYLKIFDYTMDVVPPNGKYEWKSYGGAGSIQAGPQFVSKSGTVCRNFSEVFTVGNAAGKSNGIGCQRRGKAGWCKLSIDKAQTCSFEDPPFSFGYESITVPSLRSGKSSSSSSGNYSAPNVDTTINRGGASDMPTITPDKADGQAYADTVTGTAGKAAGDAAGNGLNWFKNTFR